MSKFNSKTCCGCGKPETDEKGEVIHWACSNCRISGKTHWRQECQKGYNNYCSNLVWCRDHEDYVDGDDSGADMEEDECYCDLCAAAGEVREEIEQCTDLPREMISEIVQFAVHEVCSV